MIPSYIVDAFTPTAFGGNPAAVCLLDKEISEEKMQLIAAEFNLSETAFLQKINSDTWNLRWFTPTTEVNLCGHATLAAAHVLAHEINLPLDLFRFQTKSGELTARKSADKLELNFPRIPTTPVNYAQFVNVVKTDFVSSSTAGEDLLVELKSEEEVKNYQPDLFAIEKLDCRGLIITATSAHSGSDFVSRFFAPKFGINEDPVTGSAHCALIDFWHQKTGLTEFVARQISKRQGILHLSLLDDRVALRGNSITTAKVELLVD